MLLYTGIQRTSASPADFITILYFIINKLIIKFYSTILESTRGFADSG